MTIRSMTGFGRSEYLTPEGRIQIELRSINQKSFELSTRFPSELITFAEPVRKLVQERVRRGKVYLVVNAPDGALVYGIPHVNEPLARQYHTALKRLAKVTRITEPIRLQQIAQMPDVIRRTTRLGDTHRFWSRFRRAVLDTLNKLDASRKKEGAILLKDILKRLRFIEQTLMVVRRRAPQVVKHFAAKKSRAGSNIKDASKERQAAEVASFAKSCDITEEWVRLSSHVSDFRHSLRQGSEVGRKLDFILQEMMREANTMGSKANDVVIARKVIAIKSELEKIREQCQNLE